jgi:signal recognition particle subunit SRP54
MKVAFEGLSEKLSAAFKRLKAKGKLSKKDVQDAMREVRLALLAADVNYKVAKDFTNKIVERSIGKQVMESLTPVQMVIKIVNEELCDLMGKQQVRLEVSSKPPTIIMLCGLQGSGKTTHAAKLALSQKKFGHRPLLVACDVYRPAAITQLQVLGSKVQVPVFEMSNENPIKIARNAVAYAKDHGNDIIILDTAGRLHIDEKLMDELNKIKFEIKPTEILLVVDAMTGQDAVNVAKSFDDLLDITGVILTKLDGDTRGGSALSIRAVVGKPIKFVGTGEKLENLELFHPNRMASRILGMGDVLTLIEEAESKLDKKKAEQFAHKLVQNKLDFNDLLTQFNQIRKMGPLKSILSKFPGVQNKLDNINIDDRQIDKMCAIIFSMTPGEREKPGIIDFSRKKRIAKGSSMKVEDVNHLLKMLEGMQKMIKQFGPKGKKRKMMGLPGLGGMNNFK